MTSRSELTAARAQQRNEPARKGLTREQLDRFARKYFERLSPEDRPRWRVIYDLALRALEQEGVK